MYRSQAEANFAKALENNNIDYIFEPKRFVFDSGVKSYLPDFYLPEYDLYVEVKGALFPEYEHSLAEFVRTGNKLAYVLANKVKPDTKKETLERWFYEPLPEFDPNKTWTKFLNEEQNIHYTIQFICNSQVKEIHGVLSEYPNKDKEQEIYDFITDIIVRIMEKISRGEEINTRIIAGMAEFMKAGYFRNISQEPDAPIALKGLSIGNTEEVDKDYSKLYSALETLTDRQRKVFELFNIDRWSMTEIAEELGVSKSTIKNTHFSTLKKLRKLWEVDCNEWMF